MNELLSKGVIESLIETACQVVIEKGISTRNTELQEAANKNEFLMVRNGRIYPSKEWLAETIKHLKQNNIATVEGQYTNQHGWPDMLVDCNADNNLIVKLTDLPYQFCDHRERKIIPLTRNHTIEGTKLLHVLSEKKGIRGYSCGVPQDTADVLKPIEQYLIGFRYNKNGGATIQAISPEVEAEFAQIRAIAEGRTDVETRELMLFSPSPMILDADDLYQCFKSNITISRFMVGSMPMMGMTGPVDPIGSYTLALAESLGAAAILHALLPQAKAYIYPHPQAMDLRSGQMAFGTVEHARLEMIKIQVMKSLGLPYYNLKDIMTSAQMPGSMAQGDKALGIYTGVMAGYKAFNLMPLSTDQIWSPVQALLDIEATQNAWNTIQPLQNEVAVSNAIETISEVIDNGYLFAETADTLMNMHENYDMDVLHNRFFSSEVWATGGKPHELNAVEEKSFGLIDSWNFRPEQHKLESVIDIYSKLCKRYNATPLPLD